MSERFFKLLVERLVKAVKAVKAMMAHAVVAVADNRDLRLGGVPILFSFPCLCSM